MPMTLYDVQHAILNGIAGDLRFQVRWIQGGSTPSCNLQTRTLNLPMIDPTNNAAVTALRAYCDHELAHLKRRSLMPIHEPQHLQHICKSVDDLRVNYTFGPHYLEGSWQNIVKTHEAQAKRNARSMKTASLADRVMYDAFLINHGIDPMFAPDRPDLVGQAASIMSGIANPYSTGGDTIPVAQELYDLLFDPKNGEGQGEGEGEGEGEGNGEGESKGKGDGDGKGGKEKSEDEGDDGEGEAGDDGDGEEDGEGDGGGTDGDSEGEDGDASGGGGEGLDGDSDDGEGDEAGGDGSNNPTETEGSSDGEGGGGTGVARNPQDVKHNPNNSPSNALSKGLKSQSKTGLEPPDQLTTCEHNVHPVVLSPGLMRHRRALARALMTKGAPRDYAFSGRVAGRRLSRISVGQTRIFSRRVPDHEIDTAVVIVMDSSGSMESPFMYYPRPNDGSDMPDHKMRAMQQAYDQSWTRFRNNRATKTYPLGKAASQSWEMRTGSEYMCSVAYAAARVTAAIACACADVKADVGIVSFSDEACVVLPTGSTRNEANIRFAAAQSTAINPCSGTYIDAGIDLAIQEVNRSHRSRKVIIVCTDGGTYQSKSEEMIREAKQQGVEFIHIGMADRCRGDEFTENNVPFVFVADEKELDEKMFEQVIKVLAQ